MYAIDTLADIYLGSQDFGITIRFLILHLKYKRQRHEELKSMYMTSSLGLLVTQYLHQDTYVILAHIWAWLF